MEYVTLSRWHQLHAWCHLLHVLRRSATDEQMLSTKPESGCALTNFVGSSPRSDNAAARGSTDRLTVSVQLCGVRTHSQWRRTRTCARLATVPSEPARPTGELLHLLVARGGCCREVGWRTAEHAEAEEKVDGR